MGKAMTVSCEWGDCEHVSAGPAAHYDHLQAHIVDGLYPRGTKPAPCKWRSCTKTKPPADISHLKRHLLSAHNEHRPWECQDCGGSFKIETDAYPKGHKCSGSSTKTTTEASSSKTKIARKKNVKMPVGKDCYWATCRKKFEDDETFYNHLKQVHVPAIKTWKGNAKAKCKFLGCPHEAGTNKNLCDHLLTYHCAFKPYKCEIDTCDFSSKKKRDARPELHSCPTRAAESSKPTPSTSSGSVKTIPSTSAGSGPSSTSMNSAAASGQAPTSMSSPAGSGPSSTSMNSAAASGQAPTSMSSPAASGPSSTSMSSSAVSAPASTSMSSSGPSSTSTKSSKSRVVDPYDANGRLIVWEESGRQVARPPTMAKVLSDLDAFEGEDTLDLEEEEKNYKKART